MYFVLFKFITYFVTVVFLLNSLVGAAVLIELPQKLVKTNPIHSSTLIEPPFYLLLDWGECKHCKVHCEQLCTLLYNYSTWYTCTFISLELRF